MKKIQPVAIGVIVIALIGLVTFQAQSSTENANLTASTGNAASGKSCGGCPLTTAANAVSNTVKGVWASATGSEKKSGCSYKSDGGESTQQATLVAGDTAKAAKPACGGCGDDKENNPAKKDKSGDEASVMTASAKQCPFMAAKAEDCKKDCKKECPKQCDKSACDKSKCPDKSKCCDKKCDEKACDESKCEKGLTAEAPTTNPASLVAHASTDGCCAKKASLIAKNNQPDSEEAAKTSEKKSCCGGCQRPAPEAAIAAAETE